MKWSSVLPSNAAALIFIAGLTASSIHAADDISGVWELHYDSANVPRAELAKGVDSKALDAQVAKDMHAIRWCNFVGLPLLMDGPGSLDIVQNKTEVILVPEARAIVRHVYTDGRKHVDSATFDPTTNGNSIGTWEGDTLVVDTIGFSDKGVTAIPGGGFRTPDSHLVERIRLVGHDRLLITSSWQDPKVFVKPQVYRYIYYRAPPDHVLQTASCDPFDEERAKLLTGVPGVN